MKGRVLLQCSVPGTLGRKRLLGFGRPGIRKGDEFRFWQGARVPIS